MGCIKRQKIGLILTFLAENFGQKRFFVSTVTLIEWVLCGFLVFAVNQQKCRPFGRVQDYFFLHATT